MELTNEELKYFLFFNKITGVSALDFVENESSILFVVAPEDIGKAIGKNAHKINKMRQVLKKNIIVVPGYDDMELFLRFLFSSINILKIYRKNNNIYLLIEEKQRGAAIGKNGYKIKIAKAAVKKRFGCELFLKTKRIL